MRYVIFAACALLAFMTSARAAQLTDSVVIGDKEWAQVANFTSLSWNDIDAVCPGGPCTSGSLNGYDMSGWHWASFIEVGRLLAELTPLITLNTTIPTFRGNDPPWGEHFFSLFRGTYEDDVVKSLSGWAARTPLSLSGAFADVRYVKECEGSLCPPVSPSLIRVDQFGDLPSNARPTRGGWFYRSAPTPIPLPLPAGMLAASLLPLIRSRPLSRMFALARPPLARVRPRPTLATSASWHASIPDNA